MWLYILMTMQACVIYIVYYLREFDVDFTSVAHELKSIFILFIILIWERAFVFVVLECLLFLYSRIKIIIQVQLQCRFYHQYFIIIGTLIYLLFWKYVLDFSLFCFSVHVFVDCLILSFLLFMVRTLWQLGQQFIY